ncbi:MAG: DNA repair protein RecO [bacterium]
MSLMNRPSVSCDALVLRSWPCGETSVIASLLTRDHGYVKVIAKAARRPKSSLRSLVEPGRLVSAEFGLEPGRELQYLRGGAVNLDPMTCAPDLERTAFLLGALELIDRCRPRDPFGPMAGGEGPAGGLFEVCEDFVRVLSSPACRRPDLVFFALEWELLRLHGLAPEVAVCAACGADPEEGGAPLQFALAAGGILCASCRPEGDARGGRALSAAALDVLRLLAGGRVAVGEDVDFPRALRREIGAVLHGFLGYHLPGYRLPAALDLLRNRKD